MAFDLRSHALLSEPDILDVLNAGKGSCNSLTMAAALTMRLLGIATTIDECPVWAHRNSGHRWNVALDSRTGKWIPFGGAEINPDEFDVINDSVKAPKIFRYTFSDQDRFLPPKINRKDIPPIFRETNRIDVTDKYTVISDVHISPIDFPDTVLYLSVFNAEKWRIIARAGIKKGSAVFYNMGANKIVYLPVYYFRGEIIPASRPFILSPEGMEFIVPDLQNKKNITLSEYNRFYDIKWNIGIPAPGSEMELFYWNNKWISCGTCTVGADSVLRFSNVPSNGLFFVKSHDWQNTWQRIFTFENGKQKWF